MVSAPPPDPLPSFPHNRGRPQFASAAGQPFSHSLFFFLIRLSRTPVSSRRASLLARSTFLPTTTAASIRGGDARRTHIHPKDPLFFFSHNDRRRQCPQHRTTCNCKFYNNNIVYYLVF